MGKVDKIYNKKIKRIRGSAGEIGCAWCAYHRGENSTRTPRPDKYKNHRRIKGKYPKRILKRFEYGGKSNWWIPRGE